MFSDFLKLGADGIVSVASHFALPEMTKIKEKSEEEKWDAAAQLQDRLHGLIECLFNVSNPIPTKSLAFQLKWIMNSHISQPLHLLSEEQLGKTVEEFELLKRERAS